MASRDSGPRGQAQWVGYWGRIQPDLGALNVGFSNRFPDATASERATAFASGFRAIQERNALADARETDTLGAAIGQGEGGGTVRVRALFHGLDAGDNRVRDFSVVRVFAPGTTVGDAIGRMAEDARDHEQEYGDDSFEFGEFIVTVQ